MTVPPACLKRIYKFYRSTQEHQWRDEPSFTDFDHALLDQDYQSQGWRRLEDFLSEPRLKTFDMYDDDDGYLDSKSPSRRPSLADHFVYESTRLPGLLVCPALVPPRTQLQLLSRLLHRDLSNPSHKTNVHLHHHVFPPSSRDEVQQDRAWPRGQDYLKGSFFNFGPSSPITYLAKDSRLHRPLPASKFLSKKLRWMTLGGQYDWTSKSYPLDASPPFPEDIASFVGGLFPDVEAQAAIVNVYSPGDTLSLHRDISESCERPLVSVSLGCDAIFVVGPATCGRSMTATSGIEDCDRSSSAIAVRLHSGDVLYMSGEARFAWHGVPKIIARTCPEWMKDWPALAQGDTNLEAKPGQARFAEWRGWMEDKRINLNVRQLYD